MLANFKTVGPIEWIIDDPGPVLYVINPPGHRRIGGYYFHTW